MGVTFILKCWDGVKQQMGTTLPSHTLKVGALAQEIKHAFNTTKINKDNVEYINAHATGNLPRRSS